MSRWSHGNEVFVSKVKAEDAEQRYGDDQVHENHDPEQRQGE